MDNKTNLEDFTKSTNNLVNGFLAEFQKISASLPPDKKEQLEKELQGTNIQKAMSDLNQATQKLKDIADKCR